MTQQSKYAVILNPQAWFNKHEVWFSGMVDAQNDKGFLVREHRVFKAEAFSTEEAAQGFIKYAQDVKTFKEQTV